jgi:hypothetical protein
MGKTEIEVQILPLHGRLKADPSISRFLVKPSLTPTTML